jgi:hypothetical protein
MDMIDVVVGEGVNKVRLTFTRRGTQWEGAAYSLDDIEICTVQLPNAVDPYSFAVGFQWLWASGLILSCLVGP